MAARVSHQPALLMQAGAARFPVLIVGFKWGLGPFFFLVLNVAATYNINKKKTQVTTTKEQESQK